nr:sucrase ferredoxin [Flexivirga aerilata]
MRGDDQAGTAAPAHGWVLIEHHGPWPFGGFAELPIDPSIVQPVRHAAQRIGARVLLIRRYGRRAAGVPLRWAVLRYDAAGNHSQQWGTWTTDEDLLQIVPGTEAPGRTDLPPVFLVCTHGVHDACCAIRGRPVAAALTEVWPENTWECSHVGGDRFAANLLVLPSGVYFGEVEPAEAVEVVRDLLHGRVSASHLRGYADLNPPAQVAVIEVLRRFGPAGRHAIRVEKAVRAGERWRVLLACAPPLPPRIEVELQAHQLPEAKLTCRAPMPTQAVGFALVELRAG